MRTSTRVRTAVVLGLSALVLVGAGMLAGVFVDRARGPELDTSGLTLSGAQGTEGGRYASLYVGDLCLSGAGPAEILAVRPRSLTGGRAEITAFAVARSGSGIVGGEAGRLQSIPDMLGSHHFVAVVCDHGKDPHGLWIEVFLPEGGNAVIRGLEVEYRVGGRTRTATSDGDLGACEDLDAADCAV